MLAAPTWAQTAGQSTSPKLALFFPTLSNIGLSSLTNPEHIAHFSDSAQGNFAPFNTALAVQLSTLPLPSPASGFTYSFDPVTGVYRRTASSFGPILAERAETIGRGRFFAGLAEQHFNFDSLDGTSLDAVPVVFQHAEVGGEHPEESLDVVLATTLLTTTVDQRTAFFTYGVSDRVDVSVAVPSIQTRMHVEAFAQILRVGTYANPDIHALLGGDGSSSYFLGERTASGIGDVVTRVKATVLRAKHFSVAGGVEGRFPTGDAYDFLGSGAYGIKGLAAISAHSRWVSPHFNASYQVNGNSILAGDVNRRMPARLPNQVQYAVGFDSGISEKFTVGFDVIGQRFHTQRLELVPYQAGPYPLSTVSFRPGAAHQVSGAAGLKVNPIGRLLVNFNLLVRMNQAGLRTRVTPLIGVSYTM